MNTVFEERVAVLGIWKVAVRVYTRKISGRTGPRWLRAFTGCAGCCSWFVNSRNLAARSSSAAVHGSRSRSLWSRSTLPMTCDAEKLNNQTQVGTVTTRGTPAAPNLPEWGIKGDA